MCRSVRWLLVAFFALCLLPQGILPAPFKKGVKLNTFFRITSLPAIKFLEKYGITLTDIMATADLNNEKDKQLIPLLTALKPADFPYALFYTNEFLFSQRFPGMAAVKIDNVAWLALIRTGAEQGAGKAEKIKNRFYKIAREDLLIEILPDGVLVIPAGEADGMPEWKSLQQFHDTITAEMGVKPDDGAFMEYHEKSGFSDGNERLMTLLRGRWGKSGISARHMEKFDKILTRVLRNPFIKAVLSTKQTSVRFDLRDGLTVASDYTLGAPAHKEAFLKAFSAMQVLGSVGTTLGIAAWEVQMSGTVPREENLRVAMDLFNKFSESFEKIRVSEREDKIALTWQFVTGNDLIPAMQLAKKLVEQKKTEQRASERIEAVRDEVCAALAQKDKEKIRIKISTYAEILPADEHKIWRIKQACTDGSGILLSALEFGGEDSFLKLVGRLKYHMGLAPLVNAQGKGYLHIAVERRYEKAVRQILGDGILTNSADTAGKTALIYAIESKNATIVKLLIDHNVAIISEEDATLARKTQDAAQASGNEQIKELVDAALKREKALRKKHATQS
jgi:hypothetical protein